MVTELTNRQICALRRMAGAECIAAGVMVVIDRGPEPSREDWLDLQERGLVSPTGLMPAGRVALEVAAP